MDFGSSGSGVVRQWRKYGTAQPLSLTLSPQSVPVYQYSYAGPLTMSKGCDQALEINTRDKEARKYIYRGSNPAVVTDATCYMDWIAEQYQLELEDDYDSKASCSQSSGDKEDINQEECSTANGDRCDWTQPGYETCRLYAEEGVAKNVFQCKDTKV